MRRLRRPVGLGAVLLCLSSLAHAELPQTSKTVMGVFYSVGLPLIAAGAGMVGYAHTEYNDAPSAPTLVEFRRMNWQAEQLNKPGPVLLYAGIFLTVAGTGAAMILYAASPHPRHASNLRVSPDGTTVRF